jgi:hypothetical protein
LVPATERVPALAQVTVLEQRSVPATERVREQGLVPAMERVPELAQVTVLEPELQLVSVRAQASAPAMERELGLARERELGLAEDWVSAPAMELAWAATPGQGPELAQPWPLTAYVPLLPDDA